MKAPHTTQKTVVTNADRPATILWYKERFGYKEVGTLEKISEFGDAKIARWTTLELDLEDYMRRADREAAARPSRERHDPHRPGSRAARRYGRGSAGDGGLEEA